MDRFENAIARFSQGLTFLSAGACLILVGITLTEVFARYALNAPTRWAFDLSYMLNGTIVVWAMAYTLHCRGHVTVDFIDALLPTRLRQGMNAVFFLLLCTPVLGLISKSATERFLKSYRTGEVEMVSIWQPLIWPFHAALAIGLIALTLQCLSRGLGSCRALVAGQAVSDEAPK